MSYLFSSASSANSSSSSSFSIARSLALYVSKLICIPQVRNLEDELVRACNIKNIVDLTKSLTKADYKRDLINCSNLSDRLKKCKFDITKIWAEIPKNNFKKYGNDSEKIKIKSKK